jgi:hypothetical protein
MKFILNIVIAALVTVFFAWLFLGGNFIAMLKFIYGNDKTNPVIATAIIFGVPLVLWWAITGVRKKRKRKALSRNADEH